MEWEVPPFFDCGVFYSYLGEEFSTTLAEAADLSGKLLVCLFVRKSH